MAPQVLTPNQVKAKRIVEGFHSGRWDDQTLREAITKAIDEASPAKRQSKVKGTIRKATTKKRKRG